MALLTLGEATEGDLATAEAALKRMEADNAKQRVAIDSKRQRHELARAELQSRLDAIEPRSRELRDRLDYLKRSAIKAGEEEAGHQYREALRTVGEAWTAFVAHADLLMEVERVDRPNPMPIERRLSFGTSLVNALGPMPILSKREAFAACVTPQCIVIAGNPLTEQAGGAEIRVDRAAIVAAVRKRYGY